MKHLACVCILFMGLNVCGVLFAEDAVSSTQSSSISKAEKKPFPQWAYDLRRADIIAFGAFPFAWFFTSLFIDIYRYTSHGNAQEYAPWPLKDETALAWTDDEYKQCIWISASVAISVALIDFIIIKVKRAKAEKRSRSFIPNAPEIKRKPFDLNSTSKKDEGT